MYGAFWLRLWAQIVDVCVVVLVGYPPMRLWYGSEYADMGWVAGPVDAVTVFVLPAVAIVLLWARWGASPGKWLFSLRVVDAHTGGAPSRGRAAVRYLGYLPSTLAIFSGFVAVAFDDRKRAWHDRLAGTLVVDELGTRLRADERSRPWLQEEGAREPEAERPHWLAPLRVVGGVLAAYVAMATIWSLMLPYVPRSRNVSYLGPWMAPTELVFNLAGQLGLLLAAAVSTLLIARSWERVEARLAVFGLLFVLLPTAFLSDIGLPELGRDALDWASAAIGWAALWRFATLFPRPLTGGDFRRKWRPPGTLRRLARRVADLGRLARGRSPAEWTPQPGSGWGRDPVGPFRRPLPLDARFVWTAVLCLGAVCFGVDALGVESGATMILLLFGGWLSLHVIRLLRLSYRIAEAEERRRILWIAQGATLWITLPMLLLSAGLAGGMVADVMGSDIEFGRATGYLAAFTIRHLGQIILPASLAMAILYGGAFDPENLIRRTVLYGALGIGTILIFTGVEYLFEEQVTRLVGLPEHWSGWIAAISSAAAFGPLQTAVKRRTDAAFKRVTPAREGTRRDPPSSETN